MIVNNPANAVSVLDHEFNVERKSASEMVDLEPGKYNQIGKLMSELKTKQKDYVRKKIKTF